MCVLSHFSLVWLFVTLWTIACQAPLSMGFPGKNTGVGCHALLQEIFSIQGSNHVTCGSCMADRFFTAEPPGKCNKFNIYLFIVLLICLFLAVLDLRCFLVLSHCGEWGYSSVAVHGLLIAGASLVAEHRL